LQSFLNTRATKHLKNLRVLNLCDNQLQEFALPAPAFLRHSSSSSEELLSVVTAVMLPNLEEVDLSFNRLKELPPQLTQWKNLRVLQVNNNLLEYISPRVVLGMRNLQVLECRDNPLLQPPVVDANRGVDVMKRYYTCLLGKDYDLSLLSDQIDGDSDGDTAYNCCKFQCASLSSQGCKSKSKKMKEKCLRLGDQQKRVGDLLPLQRPLPQSPPPSRTPATRTYVNETLKVICVGVPGAGKTSMLQRLINGRPSSEDENDGSDSSEEGEESGDQAAAAIDQYDWDPKAKLDAGCYHDNNNESEALSCSLDTSIQLGTKKNSKLIGELRPLGNDASHVKFSVWDCSSRSIYHVSFPSQPCTIP
jgi:hypothetical protein